MWQQWQAFLEKKKDMLVAEIERSKLRGVTAEQFAGTKLAYTLINVVRDGG